MQYLGQHLFLRDAQGRFVRSGEAADYQPLQPTWIEMRPGQTHRIQIRGFVKSATENRGARHLVSPQTTVMLMTDDYMFDIGHAGPFEVLAMFEEHGTRKDYWTGRVVSKLVRIVIPDPPAEK